MKKLFLSLLLLFLTACVPVSDMEQSSVIVIGYSNGTVASQGSGVITEYGILTAAHVTRGMDEVAVEYHNGSHEYVEVDRFHMEWFGSTITHDIAVISHEENQHLARPIDCNPVHIQDQVFVVGHPHQMSWVMTRGRITSNRSRTYQRDDAWIHTDAVFTRGSSGGPVFNTSGHVIGIVSHMDMMQSNRVFVPSGFGFAVSGPEICSFLKITKQRTPFK